MNDNTHRHTPNNTQDTGGTPNTGPTIFTPIRSQLARRLLTGKEDEIKRRVNVPTVFQANGKSAS
jgi:hypothetical protein